MTRVLIVDDEPDICELLSITLSRMKLEVSTAQNLKTAFRLLNVEVFDLVLTDMHLPDGEGLQLIEHVQKILPHLPVAVITAFGSMDLAISALKAGAFDFVTKPVELQRLRTLVQSALQRPSTSTSTTTKSILMGNSAAMCQLRDTVDKVARGQAPVFIIGESGSGKERVARSIHQLSVRNTHPFIAINCGAIPTELMESEFFGHKKGSFTGAADDKSGLFQAADQGTLFLDEVADLPLGMQVKLLRSLQEKSVRPVGATQEVPVNVRIISATHKNIQSEVQEGRFRQDLYYRLHVIPITVPPLRERQEDIALLSQKFLEQIAVDWSIPTPQLSAAAEEALRHYPFLGNVRELQNILERAITLSEQRLILPEHLQLPIYPASAEPNNPQRPQAMPLEDYLQEIEKTAIMEALFACNWNRTLTARKLGMSFRSLRYRLKKMGIEPIDNECDESD